VRQRTAQGVQEVVLQSWKAAQDPAQWEDSVMRAVLCGVSSRDVACLSAEEALGQSKASVSRLWQKKASVLVEEVQQSDLLGFDLLVLMVDAVVLGKNLVATVALGIDTRGYKKVLGFRIGGSENKEVCKDLLSNLQRRGLQKKPGRRLLAVLDGSEALRGAVMAHYPDTLVQRCLVHKERNVRGYLSKRHWAELAALFKKLRQGQGEKEAEAAAEALRAFLKDKNAQARESFEEAGEDLLRLFELEVPNTLHRTLLSTNCIENVFKNLRRHIGRVCRWHRETDQADRWMASGLKLAETGFRRIVGHGDLEKLKQALEKSEANRQAA
jgi:transposase-like protein